MASPRWSDFGSIWKTIREVDVLAIRREAEHDLTVARATVRLWSTFAACCWKDPTAIPRPSRPSGWYRSTRWTRASA